MYVCPNCGAIISCNTDDPYITFCPICCENIDEFLDYYKTEKLADEASAKIKSQIAFEKDKGKFYN